MKFSTSTRMMATMLLEQKKYFCIPNFKHQRSWAKLRYIVVTKIFQLFRATPDIALVKLERQVKFSYYVRPICLNFKRNEKPVCPDQSRDRSRLSQDPQTWPDCQYNCPQTWPDCQYNCPQTWPDLHCCVQVPQKRASVAEVSVRKVVLVLTTVLSSL